MGVVVHLKEAPSNPWPRRLLFLLLAVLPLLGLVSCGPDPSFVRDCSARYERCADAANTFPEYLRCRSEVDRECIR